MVAGKKAQIPAPIDRPLSRAYLREFSGWSTAFPPSLSDPTSLRIMENTIIERDGSVRVRPGLKYLSYSGAGITLADQVVGTHEAFYLNDGSKAYLFAIKEATSVGFRVLTYVAGQPRVLLLTDPLVGFNVIGGSNALNFTLATTYVKYLQIDNKLFALSNKGEEMRLFRVGATKEAKALSTINWPEWSVPSKLDIVHPTQTWINASSPTARTNALSNPSFEIGTDGWNPIAGSKITRSTDAASMVTGSASGKLESPPSQLNQMPKPLHNVNLYGISGWSAETSGASVAAASNKLELTSPAAAGDYYSISPACDVDPAAQLQVAYDSTIVRVGALPKVKVRYFNSVGAQVGSDLTLSITNGSRCTSNTFTVPAGVVSMKVLIGSNSLGAADVVRVSNVLVSSAYQSSAMFDPDAGGYNGWLGAVNNSASELHSPADAEVASNKCGVLPLTALNGSIYAKTTGGIHMVTVYVEEYDSTGGLKATSSASTSVSGSTRLNVPIAATDTDTSRARIRVKCSGLSRGQVCYLDSGLLESGVSAVGTYFDGSTAGTSTTVNSWNGLAHKSSSNQEVLPVGLAAPVPVARAANTLISNVSANNVYRFAFFYTFSNEVGESAASQISVVRAKRGWSQWFWETPDAASEPSGTETGDPTRVADQLIAVVPDDVFAGAIGEGATKWTLYMFTWSDQDPVPTTAVKIDERTLTSSSVHGQSGWIRTTPVLSETASEAVMLPNKSNRYNYSNPSSAGQGLVAADRMILVYDPNDAAVIRWTSNQQGEYTNFTANKGGGYKTLTSGNQMVPACVKLWQNPQSADTLTILCQGTDGHSTGYFMAPAQVASQSEAVNIMGFEETTATPGTTSPFGCEVFNNALYHPLDDQLMKSTAMNYNISHKSQTENIRNMWEELATKELIVSSSYDNRLYYIVNNPSGVSLPAGCNGNEIWVFDVGAEGGSWSRWLVPAHSLRKIEIGGRNYMSVVCPEGIFYLDPEQGLDEYVSGGGITTRPIPWKLETNTQGANRSHDAWAHLQQVTVNLGNFLGVMRYGIRSFDLNGKTIEVSKIVRDDNPASALTWDLEDSLLVKRNLKEWRFFAESVDAAPSVGQINFVQYRYTPSTVNTGYEHGSVETFEYGRVEAGTDTYTTNGTPRPMIDTRRP